MVKLRLNSADLKVGYRIALLSSRATKIFSNDVSSVVSIGLAFLSKII